MTDGLDHYVSEKSATVCVHERDVVETIASVGVLKHRKHCSSETMPAGRATSHIEGNLVRQIKADEGGLVTSGLVAALHNYFA